MGHHVGSPAVPSRRCEKAEERKVCLSPCHSASIKLLKSELRPSTIRTAQRLLLEGRVRGLCTRHAAPAAPWRQFSAGSASDSLLTVSPRWPETPPQTPESSLCGRGALHARFLRAPSSPSLFPEAGSVTWPPDFHLLRPTGNSGEQEDSGAGAPTPPRPCQASVSSGSCRWPRPEAQLSPVTCPRLVPA